MYDDWLRTVANPPNVATYDWMHIFFVSGVFNTHLGIMMWSIKEYGITYQVVDNYLQRWCWPQFASSVTGKDSCCRKRAKASWETGVFKATASKGLSLMPVLALFFTETLEKSPVDEIRRHMACFLLLVAVCNLVVKTTRCNVDPNDLETTVSAYLKAFKELYGEQKMILKFHYSMHLGMLLRRYSFLPSCFVHERKHKLPQKYANQVTNITSRWEAGVLREVTCHHVSVLRNDATRFKASAGLVDHTKPRRLMLNHLQGLFGEDCVFGVARSARTAGYEKIIIHDVVLYNSGGRDAAGQIKFIASVEREGDTVHVVCVEVFEQCAVGRSWQKWQRRHGEATLCLLEDVRYAMLWREDASGDIVTVNSLGR